MPGTKVTLYPSQLREFLDGPRGFVSSVVLMERTEKVRREVRRIIAAEAYDTGKLHRSVRAEVITVGGRSRGVVFSPLDYAWYVEVGTGIYGPRHRMIVARPGHVFRWVDRLSGDTVFATSTRGRHAVHMFERSVKVAGGTSRYR